MNEATAPQLDFLYDLRDRVRENYDSDLLFYEIVERITKKRTTEGLTKQQASQIIDAVKSELL